jgi:hypothetical protein
MTPYERDDRAEQALRDAFRARADAFDPEVLSGDPVPRSRRAWPVVLLASAAVLVLAVGALVWRSAGSDDSTPPPAAGDVNLPDGWRWESHADVEVAVPDSWGYGAAPGSDWCAGHEEQNSPDAPVPHTPYMDTANALSGHLDILCNGDVPLSLMAPHLSFVDAPDPNSNILPSDVLSGWTTMARDVGSTRVVMTTDGAHQDLARQILATAHVVARDQNGCAATSPIQAAHAVRPDPAFDVTRLQSVDSIAVCQYLTHGTGQPGLLASRLMTGSAADAELLALRSAPTGGGPDEPQNCIPDGWGDSAVVLRLTSGDQTHDMYGYYEWCFGNGFDDGTAVRELTTQDCETIWGGRVQLLSGSSAPFERCRPSAF